MDAGTLHVAIAEVCPVISVRMIYLDDRESWSYEPAPEATAAEKTAADNVIATIPMDYVAPAPLTPQDTLAFDHENRLRTLEGLPLLTMDEFLTTKLAP